MTRFERFFYHLIGLQVMQIEVQKYVLCKYGGSYCIFTRKRRLLVFLVFALLCYKPVIQPTCRC